MVYAKVIRTGKSVAIILPVAICHAFDIHSGDYVALFAYGEDVLAIRKVVEEPELPIIKID